jgi:hypothetical protein
MKVALRLLQAFFVVCILIHVYGLYSPITDEGVTSHIIHIISYSLCFMGLGALSTPNVLFYTLGCIYPFYYHFSFLAKQFYTNYTINFICLLVSVLLPTGWLLLRKNKMQNI